MTMIGKLFSSSSRRPSRARNSPRKGRICFRTSPAKNAVCKVVKYAVNARKVALNFLVVELWCPSFSQIPFCALPLSERYLDRLTKCTGILNLAISRRSHHCRYRDIASDTIYTQIIPPTFSFFNAMPSASSRDWRDFDRSIWTGLLNYYWIHIVYFMASLALSSVSLTFNRKCWNACEINSFARGRRARAKERK